MAPALYITGGIASIALFYFVLPRLVQAGARYRAKMVLTCPETRKPVAVKVDLGRAAIGSVIGRTDIKLTSCTRWPERQDCDQECLLQIQMAPEECIVKTILAKWYENKYCVFCGRPFRQMSFLEPKDAMLDTRSGISIEYSDVPPERLPDLLATYEPVCADCHIAETFRRIDPEMVVDRPWRQTGSWHV